MKLYICIYCDKEINEEGHTLIHRECFNSEYAIKLRAYSFLSSYSMRNAEEEKQLLELKEYLENLGKLPPWPIVKSEFNEY